MDDTPERGAQNLGAVLDLAQDLKTKIRFLLYLELLIAINKMLKLAKQVAQL